MRKIINYLTNDDIRKRYIFDSKDDGISRSYIFGYEKDNPSYEYLKTKIFLEKSDEDSRDEETVYTNNLAGAKSFFKEKVSKMTFPEVECLFRKLTQNMLFNIYSMSDDIDVYITFETMNNRGKPLSILELLKNRLIFLSTKLVEDVSEKSKLRTSINEAWKTIYHNLGKNKDSNLVDDIFLLNHFFYYFGRDLFKDDDTTSYRYRHRNLRIDYKDYLLENLFTIKNVTGMDASSENELIKFNRNVDLRMIYDYVRSLKSSVEIWFDILNPKLSSLSDAEKECLYRILRLEPQAQNSSYFILILVFFVKTTNVELRVELLSILEKSLFISTLVEYRWRWFFDDESFLQMSIELAADKYTVQSVVEHLKRNLAEAVEDERFMPEIIKLFKNYGGFYRWSGIRYFLYEYEQSLKIKSKTQRDKIVWDTWIDENDDDYKSIEHIYPQKSRANCWQNSFKNYTAAERKLLKNSLGNLLPLSTPKNSSLSNKCFNEKKAREGQCVGYAFGCYSEIEVSQCQNWGAQEILERGIKLLEFLQENWGIRFSNHQQALQFLGIQFVPKKEVIKKEVIKNMNRVFTNSSNKNQI